MWIFTTTGFVSIVEDTKNKRMVLVRSRSREHLKEFVKYLHPKRARITFDNRRDYPWRIRVSKVRAAEAVFDSMLEIKYPNFKNAAADRLGESDPLYIDVLHEVYWSVALPRMQYKRKA